MRLRNPLMAGCLAGFLVLAAACGDDGGSSDGDDDTTDEATDEPSDGTSIDVWTASICTSLTDWIDAITAIDDDAQDVVGLQGTVETDDTGDDTGFDTGENGNRGSANIEPDEARRILVGLFGDAADASDELIEGLEDAGVPDIDDGQELNDLFLENFTNVREAFATARDDAEDLPVDDPEDFTDAAQTILDDIEIASIDVQTAFNEASTELDVDEFEDAFADDEACEGIADAGA
ncbi:MAG: hypothetical protein ACRDWD_11420 [Acidimicrobiia bacterium]